MKLMKEIMNIRTLSRFEPCHAKRALMIFVIVIPKEDLAGNNPAKPSFGMAATIKYNLILLIIHQNKKFVIVIKMKAWLDWSLVPANPLV